MQPRPTLAGLALLLALCAGCAARDVPPTEARSMLPDFDQQWDYGDPATTEATFRELLAAHPRAELGWRYELRTQVARTLGLQQRFDEALAELDALERDHPDAPARARVRARLERGRALNSSGAPDRARAPFEQALELARDADEDGLAVDAAHMLAIVAPSPEAAFEWTRRALELAEASADPDARRWRGALHNNLGWTYHESGRFAEALVEFERSRDAFAELGRDDRARVARWSMARALRSLRRFDEALAAQNALLAELEALGETDGYVFEELGENLLALERPAEAAPWFQRAWVALKDDPWLQRDEPERLQRMRELGGAEK
jgi:tetratricopeptide (TPR) repeat protein